MIGEGGGVGSFTQNERCTIRRQLALDANDPFRGFLLEAESAASGVDVGAFFEAEFRGDTGVFQAVQGCSAAGSSFEDSRICAFFRHSCNARQAI